MRTIVVIAYQMHQKKGSEYSLAWNYVNNMSKNNKLIVLYGTCDGHHRIGNVGEFEEYITNNPVPNVEFVAVRPTFKVHNYDFSISGIRGFYKEYRLWHRDVCDKIKEINTSQKIDLIHYLGPIGFREPGFAWELDIPFVWGPLGGFDGIKFRHLKATMSFMGGLSLFLKRVVNFWVQKTDKHLKEAMCSADVLIGATSDYVRAINGIVGKNHHSKVLYMPESCMERKEDLNYDKFNDPIVRLLWVGSVDPRKGILFILDALTKIDKNAPIHLDVINSGPIEDKAKAWAEKHGISHFISWRGKIDRSEVFGCYHKSHLHLQTSLADANTVVMWEAFTTGVPSLVLDHCGMHDIVSDKSGIKIKAGGYKQIVNDIAVALNRVIGDRTLLKDMAEQVIVERDEYSWERRREKFEEIYALAEEQFNKRKA